MHTTCLNYRQLASSPFNKTAKIHRRQVVTLKTQSQPLNDSTAIDAMNA